MGTLPALSGLTFTLSCTTVSLLAACSLLCVFLLLSLDIDALLAMQPHT